MKPFRTLAETHTPDGSRFTLHEHDGEYFMKLNGRQLMSTSSTASELLLAQKSCALLSRHGHPRVLIGGLGLGFSLRRALELVGPRGTVQVAELLGEVVAWNRDFLLCPECLAVGVRHGTADYVRAPAAGRSPT